MADGVNTIPRKSIYPSFGGLTLGQRGSAATAPAGNGAGASSAKAEKQPSEAQQAAQVGAQGSPIVWLAVLAVMLGGLMFLAQRFGSEGAAFARIKLSFYNVLIIALAAVIGINIFKFVFTHFKVPGLSSVMLAA